MAAADSELAMEDETVAAPVVAPPSQAHRNTVGYKSATYETSTGGGIAATQKEEVKKEEVKREPDGSGEQVKREQGGDVSV